MKKTYAAAAIVLSMVWLTSHAAGPDYELMFGHSRDRWVHDLELLGRSSATDSVQLDFLCRENGQAVGLAAEYSNDTSVVERGNWLGYTFKVSVQVPHPRQRADLALWARRQFFVGVAYECDLDKIGNENEREHSL